MPTCSTHCRLPVLKPTASTLLSVLIRQQGRKEQKLTQSLHCEDMDLKDELSVGKELVGLAQPGGCGQRLHVQAGVVLSIVPRGSLLRPLLFNTFINDVDGTTCTPSSLQMAPSCGAADTTKGRDATQRNLDRLKKWACGNLTRFSEANRKELRLGWGNPRGKLTESSSAKEDKKLP